MTGWSEEFIRWDLPLSRAWSYYHCAILADGGNAEWASEMSRKRKAFDDKIKRLTQPFQK